MKLFAKVIADIGFVKGHQKHSASSLRFKGFSDALVMQMNIPLNQ